MKINELPDTLVVLRDTAEKKHHRLLFPTQITVGVGDWWTTTGPGRTRTFKVVTEDVSLKCGDYTIQGKETVTAWEKKGSLLELLGNVSKPDSTRFLTALSRFSQTVQRPWLLLAFTPKEAGMLWLPYARAKGRTVAWVLDRILSIAAASKLSIMWAGPDSNSLDKRRKLGTLVLRTMIQEIQNVNPLTKQTCLKGKSSKLSVKELDSAVSSLSI